MTIDELYSQIYNDQTTKELDRFIDIYEANMNLVDNIAISANEDIHYKAMRLTADYAHNLTNQERYAKAIPEIQKAIRLFESYPDFKDSNLLRTEFYETLIFDRAIANFHLRNLNKATKDLGKLTSEFPDSDKYRNWLAATKVRKQQRQKNILWYIFASIMITITFFDKGDFGDTYYILLFTAYFIFFSTVAGDVQNLIRKKEK